MRHRLLSGAGPDRPDPTALARFAPRASTYQVERFLDRLTEALAGFAILTVGAQFVPGGDELGDSV